MYLMKSGLVLRFCSVICHGQGSINGDPEAAGIDVAGTCEIAGRAVIDRSADYRQAQGDVHCAAKP